MTEAQWLESNDPPAMLEFLRKSGKLSERKLRLFACACARRVWNLLSDPRCRQAVEVAERYADGQASAAEIRAAFGRVVQAGETAWEAVADGRVGRTPAEAGQANAAAEATNAAIILAGASERGQHGQVPPNTYRCCAEAAVGSARAAAYAATQARFFPHASLDTNRFAREPDYQAWVAAQAAERVAQTALLRCVFGPLAFRPVAIDPAALLWRDGCVAATAQRIYEKREFQFLPLLAELLREAGGADADADAHCRTRGEHARGCWVVDLILGKP